MNIAGRKKNDKMIKFALKSCFQWHLQVVICRSEHPTQFLTMEVMVLLRKNLSEQQRLFLIHWEALV